MIQENSSFICKIEAMKQIMKSCFNIPSATADWIKRVKKTILEFVVTKMVQSRHNLVICLIPVLLKQLYVLLEEGLINCRILFKITYTF